MSKDATPTLHTEFIRMSKSLSLRLNNPKYIRALVCVIGWLTQSYSGNENYYYAARLYQSTPIHKRDWLFVSCHSSRHTGDLLSFGRFNEHWAHKSGAQILLKQIAELLCRKMTF
jgi:hypothetical protein